jgi:RNA polymerase sigma factor (sigma-70 family)
MLVEMTTTDLELLRQFTRDHSQEAFTTLVQRQVNLVYSTALRQVRSPQLAEDIAQSVFADLARDAEKLKPDTILTAWLYAVTRRTAIDVIRKESRRQLREQIAVEMNHMNTTANEWTQIEPLLDDAMAALDETDRSAILLRYFENKTLREVGEALGTNDDAAQKRVSRAVEQLRDFFAKQKITVGAGGLIAVISSNAVQAAPAGLAATISAAASGIAATVGLTMIHKILITGFAAVAIGGGIYLFHLQKQIAVLQEQQILLRQQIAQMSQERDDATNQLAAAQRRNEQRQNNQDELLRLRGETGVLRRQLDEATKNNRTLPAAVMAMNTNSSMPQIHIKARFLTMPKDVSAGWYDSTSAGILTDENFRIAVKHLSSRTDVETLAEPEVTDCSGRPFRMRATQTISVVTNFCLQETNGTSSIVPQTENIETGPVFEATPRVLPDGYTIELPVIASVVEFLGYAPSTNTTPAYNSAGQEVDVPTVSPQFRVQSTTNSVNLFDDQTLVFGLKDNQVQTDAALAELDGSKSNSLNRHTLVFVTATIIDPAGNRVHEDASYTNIPPQPVSQ